MIVVYYPEMVKIAELKAEIKRLRAILASKGYGPEGEKPRHTEALSCFAEESTTRDCQGVGHYMCRKCGRLEARP